MNAFWIQQGINVTGSVYGQKCFSNQKYVLPKLGYTAWRSKVGGSSQYSDDLAGEYSARVPSSFQQVLMTSEADVPANQPVGVG